MNILMLIAIAITVPYKWGCWGVRAYCGPYDYEGRHDPDHTAWLLYFVETMARAADELQRLAKSLYQGAAPDALPWEEVALLSTTPHPTFGKGFG